MSEEKPKVWNEIQWRRRQKHTDWATCEKVVGGWEEWCTAVHSEQGDQCPEEMQIQMKKDVELNNYTN